MLDQLIMTTVEAAERLRNRILDIRPDARFSPQSGSRRGEIYYDVAAPSAADKEPTRFFCSIGRDEEFPEDITFSVRASGDFRKQRLGIEVLRASVGVACELKKPVLHIEAVNDGPSLWPIFGCITLLKPDDLADNIRTICNRVGTQSFNAPFMGLLGVAETNPWLALRLLAQTKADNTATEQQKREILKRTCDRTHMVLMLDEPSTRAMLEPYVGSLPPFAAPKDGAWLERMRSSLADAPKGPQTGLSKASYG